MRRGLGQAEARMSQCPNLCGSCDILSNGNIRWKVLEMEVPMESTLSVLDQDAIATEVAGCGTLESRDLAGNERVDRLSFTACRCASDLNIQTSVDTFSVIDRSTDAIGDDELSARRVREPLPCR